MSNISLRQAVEEDLAFLFHVSTLAMRPVREALQGTEKNLEEYKVTFEPEKVEVIQYNGKDIGRLRIVRSKENIYIGGIQILPEFQGKGIGTFIMQELIKEADDLHIPILLEVHDVNIKAKSFYMKLGFKFIEVVGEKSTMMYSPL